MMRTAVWVVAVVTMIAATTAVGTTTTTTTTLGLFDPCPTYPDCLDLPPITLDGPPDGNGYAHSDRCACDWLGADSPFDDDVRLWNTDVCTKRRCRTDVDIIRANLPMRDGFARVGDCIMPSDSDGHLVIRPCPTETTTPPTVVTTTSTSTTSTSTTTLSYAIDDFERNTGLGSDWQPLPLNTSVGCDITGDSDLYTDGIGFCEWPALTPTTQQYACGQLTGTGDGEAGVCVAMDTFSAGRAVCCWASNAYWAMGLAPGGVVDNGTSPLFASGDFIGIQRAADARTYRCSRSTDGMTWTVTGAADQTINGFPNPGDVGAVVFGGSDPYHLEVWEGGSGTLPTTRPCGQATTTTTSSSTSTSSSTTTTTSSTSTSTSSTTTTLGGCGGSGFVCDDFERASLGASWVSTGINGSSCTIQGSSDYSGTDPDDRGFCYYDDFTPTTAQYACVKISSTDDGYPGACVAMGSGTAFCCRVLTADDGGGWQPISYGPIINLHGGDSTPAFAVGDYIGVERESDGQTFHCYRSTNGTTWTLLADEGGGSDTRTGLPNPGRTGATGESDGLIEAWEGGDGTLPTGRACGTPP